MKSIGRTRKSFDVVFPERAVELIAAITCNSTSKVISTLDICGKGEMAILGSAMYDFHETGPSDNEILQFAIVAMDKGVVADYEMASEMFASLARKGYVYDVKAYEMTGTDFVWVSEGKYVDFDPDQPIIGDDNQQLALIVKTNTTAAPQAWCHLWYTKILHQTIHGNDSAWTDMSFHEVIDNHYGQQNTDVGCD